MVKTYFKKDEWFGNIRGDILSGLVVALQKIHLVDVVEINKRFKNRLKIIF